MKKIATSIIPFLKYILFIWIAAGGCYDLYFYGAVRYVDNLYFIIAYFLFCGLFKFVMNRNRELRKSQWGNSFIDGIIIEAYFVTLFAQEHLYAAVFLALALAIIHVFLFLAALSLNEGRADSGEIIKRCKDRTQRLVCCLAAAVLIIPSCVGFYEEYIEVDMTAEEWSALEDILSENTDEPEKTLFEKHEKTIQQIDEWDSLDNDSKVELICKIGIIELENLGIDDDVGISIEADKIDENTMGYYVDSEKQIVINIGHICSDDVTENIDTIAHEVFHAYQHYVVSSVDFDSEFVKTSHYYKDAREWKDNIQNYISADYDFQKYQSQPLEADASEYASERVEEYMLAIL